MKSTVVLAMALSVTMAHAQTPSTETPGFVERLKGLVFGAPGNSALSPEQQAESDRLVSQIMSELHTNLKPIPMRTDLGEGKIAGEDQAIETGAIDAIKMVLSRSYTGETQGVVKGDHGKNLACLNGKIRFYGAQDIPLSLQKGVVVPDAEYEVLARLSNAEMPHKSDKGSISQGVALKLKSISKNVRGQTRIPDFANLDEQDFLMTSAPTFFLPDIVTYSAAFGQRNGERGPLEALQTIVRYPELSQRLVEEIGAWMKNNAPGVVRGQPDSILVHPYWSKHAFAWGQEPGNSVAVKYSVEPCANAQSLKRTVVGEAEFQKEMITEAFEQNKEICFHLRVQERPANAKAAEFPIEVGNVEWKESVAPFHRVATVRFLAQDNVGWRDRMAECGMTEFSPWNGLMAHQPLGNLARGRRYVYKASALTRAAAHSQSSSK